MSFWSHPWKSFSRAVTHPISSINNQIAKPLTKAIKNPADALLPQNLRDSSFYTHAIKPVVKTGTGIGLGYLTGGIPGAIAGGISSVAGGSLTSQGFSPVSNIVMPTVAGLTAGYSNDTGLFAPDTVGGATAQQAGQAAVNQAATSTANQAATEGAKQAVTQGAGQAATQGAGQAAVQGAGQAAAETSLFDTIKNTAINMVTGGKDSTFLNQVVKYGSTGLQLLQGVTGLQASHKEQQLAQQAQQAALAGNSQALQNALASLTHELNLRKGAALATMGASGFITRRGSGGTMLDLIDGALMSNDALQRKYATTMSGNNANQINAQAAQAKATAAAHRMAAFGDLGTAGMRLVSAMNPPKKKPTTTGVIK